MKNILAGTIAGLVATAPMTAVMELLHHLPTTEPTALPPRTITMRLAKKVGLKKRLNETQRREATLASHFAYGGVAGALYGVMYAPVAENAPGHPALKGMAFGLLVWTVSYLGWLPVTEILRSATQYPARRNILMILAHLVWGASLGVLTERWKDEPESS